VQVPPGNGSLQPLAAEAVVEVTKRSKQPGVPVLAATAEALALAEASLDAVAQAFHGFDPDRAFAELARVLRPGGRVELIGNARDRSVDGIDALWAIMDRVEERAPRRDHESWRDSALGERVGFGELREGRFHHVQYLSMGDVIERFASVSHVAVLPPDERTQVIDGDRPALDVPTAPRGVPTRQRSLAISSPLILLAPLPIGSPPSGRAT
jgi:SAM-dependent methyltransferase